MFEGSQNALHSGPHALPGLTAAGSLRASGPPPAVRRRQSQDAAPETVGGPRGAHLHGHLPGGLRCGVAPITGLTVQRGLRRASLAGGSPVQLGSTGPLQGPRLPRGPCCLAKGSQLPFARSPAGGAVAHGKQSTWFACPRPASREAKEEAGRPALPSLLTPFFPLTLSLPRAQGVPEREAAPGSGRVCRSPAHSPACRRGSPVHLTQPAGQVSCLQHRHWQKCHFFSRPACWWSLTVAPHCRALRARGPGTCGSGPGRRRPRPQLGGALGRAGSSWRGDVSAGAGRGFLASGRSLLPSASWLCSFTFGAQPPGPPSDSPGGGSPPPGLEWLFLLLLPLRALLVALVPALGLEFGTVPQRAVTPCGR